MNADDLEETLTRLTENHFDPGIGVNVNFQNLLFFSAVKAKEVGKRLNGLVAAHRADTLGTR